MSAEIIELPVREPPAGNGARAAMVEISSELADFILAELWMRGFKVVPLDGSEE